MSAMASVVSVTSNAVLPGVSIRLAQESDLTAVLALLLTSFRQFPLFDFLYSPLNENFDVAHDTVFFWRRRLLLDLLDPETSVIVAEAPLDSLVSARVEEPDSQADPIYQKSLGALGWTQRNGLSTRSTLTGENVVVGFAVWRFLDTKSDTPQDTKIKHTLSWYDKVKSIPNASLPPSRN
jgi:hypothetical protein